MENRLTIIKEFQKPGKNRNYIHYLCRCICGNITEVYKYRYLDGSSTSCGCYANELLVERSATHNMSRSKLYNVHSSIIDRIYNKKREEYPNYGGRGITICQDWDSNLIGRTEAFNNFRDWALKHGYSERFVIDRIDTDGNYCPNNCRFVTMEDSNRNKRNVKLYEYKGIYKNLTDWSKDQICKVKYHTLIKRIKNGWDIERALTIQPDVTNRIDKL